MALLPGWVNKVAFTRPGGLLEIAVRTKGLAESSRNIEYSEDREAFGLPLKQKIMERKTYCVYNQTRECFLCLGVTPADTILARLKGLIGKLKLKLDEGLWVVPSQGVHTFGVMFPLDLIYLDDQYRVIHVIEHFPRFRIAPIRIQSASVLQLPTHTIYSSQTQAGDQLIICSIEEIESRFQPGTHLMETQVR